MAAKPKKKHSHKRALMAAYRRALKANGPRNWWPGDSRIEIMVGAILTQNTAWKNVEKAIHSLKKGGALTYRGLLNISQNKLAHLIRSSGYYNMKAKKLKALVQYLQKDYQGSIQKMMRHDTEVLREELLEVHGIGPETADSILLYALDKPSFVVDTYTKRIFSRHGLFAEDVKYDEMRRRFMDDLDGNLDLFNEYHAQIVFIGHHYCRKTPLCDQCPWNWITF